MNWMLGMSAWIIQDGNYGDVRRHDRLEAAVEFGLEGAPALVNDVEPSAHHIDGSTYDVVARVVIVEPDVWVVDVGLRVFNEQKPPVGLAVGDVISGWTYLDIDPFFYFERLGRRASMPPLIYTWDVIGIARQTAPFVPAGPRLQVRDDSRLGWGPIEQTDAWADDGGHADYVLTCQLSSDPPKRKRGSDP